MANILVVENDPDLGEIFIQILEDAGHKAVVNSTEKMREVLAQPFDLAVLGVFMPDYHAQLLKKAGCAGAWSASGGAVEAL